MGPLQGFASDEGVDWFSHGSEVVSCRSLIISLLIHNYPFVFQFSHPITTWNVIQHHVLGFPEPVAQINLFLSPGYSALSAGQHGGEKG